MTTLWLVSTRYKSKVALVLNKNGYAPKFGKWGAILPHPNTWLLNREELEEWRCITLPAHKSRQLVKVRLIEVIRLWDSNHRLWGKP